MNMIMKIRIAITQPKIKMVITRLIFELGAPNFARQQIQIIPTDDENDHGDDDDGNDDDSDDDDDNDDESEDDDELDDEDQNGNNSANFQARSSRFCMVIDQDNT